MKKHPFNRKGFTVIETVAAITIISLVLVSAFAIAINTRIQLIAQERRILAQQEITLVRSQTMARVIVDLIRTDLDTRPNNQVVLRKAENLGEIIVIDDNGEVFEDCSAGSGSPYESLCELFNDDFDFDDAMEVQLLLRLQSSGIEVIEVTVTAQYHDNRTVSVEGLVFVPSP